MPEPEPPQLTRQHAAYVAFAVVGILILLAWTLTGGDPDWMTLLWLSVVLFSGVYVICREHGEPVDDA